MPVPTINRLPPNTELVEVTDDGVIILKEASPSLGEIGSTGMTSYGNIHREEYNAKLRGRTGRIQFNKMRRSDGQVQGVLRLLKTPILAARWYVTPGGPRKKDQQIADFVTQCLWKHPTSSFPQTLSEVLTLYDFGFSAFEKVWTFKTVQGKERVVLQKLSQRHALDIDEFLYDPKGGPAGLRMWDPNAQTGAHVDIPIDKLLVFTYEKEGGDMEGVSVLRPAYKHWFYKENLYKVDAIQKERHGIGIPVIKLPPGFKDVDKDYAQQMGRNLRTNESAHIVIPPMWEVCMLKLEGSMTDALKSIEHHDLQIARAVLGQFLNSDASSSVEMFMELFLKSTRFVADNIRDVINKHLIPELVDYNFTGNFEYPELRVRRLGDTVDWRTMSFALRNFAGAGMLIPDEMLEEWVRDEMDLPRRDTATERKILNLDTPQGEELMLELEDEEDPEQDVSGRAGMPRQSNAGDQRKGPGSNGRIGRDGSRS